MDASTGAERPGGRSLGLDAARALAVVAMVFGHTADGLLDDAVRAWPAVKTYWSFRGLTAPLFLMVSGWAVMASIHRSPEGGLALLRRRLPRVALLLGIGVLMRFPGIGGWRYLSERGLLGKQMLGFDALHTIAVSLLLVACVMAWVGPGRRRVAVLVMFAVGLPLVSGPIAGSMAQAPQHLRSMFVAEYTSPFPLVPWVSYFFSGALLFEGLRRVPARWGRVALLLAFGAACVAAAHWIGLSGQALTSPVLVLYRVGKVLLVAALAEALPAVLARPMGQVGRASLVVYASHLPIVYGWWSFPGLGRLFGHSFSLPQVALTALGLLGLGMGLDLGLSAAKRRLRAEPAKAPASEVAAQGAS